MRHVVLSLADYGIGLHEFGPMALPDDVIRVGVDVQRCTATEPDVWPNANVAVKAELEVSFDNGVVWWKAGGFGSRGGVHVHRDGHEMSYSSYNVVVRAGAGRIIRGSLEVLNGSLRTLVGLTWQ